MKGARTLRNDNPPSSNATQPTNMAYIFKDSYSPDTRRCYDVESTPMTLIQRRSNLVRPVGSGERRRTARSMRIKVFLSCLSVYRSEREAIRFFFILSFIFLSLLFTKLLFQIYFKFVCTLCLISFCLYE